MKKKSLFYLIIGICGIVLIFSAFVVDGKVSDAIDGTLMGAGTSLMGIGISTWRFFRLEKKNPEKWKQYEIESNDERNVIIKYRAKAVSGEVLQWIVLATSWVAIFFDAPLWVILTVVGVFLLKTILEMCLMAQYQKEM